jgi:ABC-2 type transport system ATP-binding protein
MQQRLHVALSMVHHPRLWLLDEPFVGLDDMAQDILWRTLAEHRERGGTAVLVCSDFARIAQSADTILVLSRGKLVAQGKPSELSQHHGSLERAYDVLTGKSALN